MSLPLIIWLPDDLQAPWQWAQGDRCAGAHSDAEKSALGELDTAQVKVVIAGQSVRQFDLDLPPMKDADRPAAAGFAIENQLATSLSGEHLVLGSAEDKKVIVISHTRIKDILGSLSHYGMTPTALYADFDVIPNKRPVLLPDRAIYPGPQGYTLDRDWADSSSQDDHIAQVMGSLNFESGLNLLSGAYAHKADLPLSAAGLARIAALLLVSGAAWLGLQASQTRAVIQQTQAVKNETAALYTAATGQTPPNNPALAITRAVKDGGGQQAGFLDLSSLLFQSLAEIDGIMIETLQFDSQKNQLSLRLIYPEFESPGALETTITRAGGEFRSGGVREQSGRLIGDATLKATP